MLQQSILSLRRVTSKFWHWYVGFIDAAQKHHYLPSRIPQTILATSVLLVAGLMIAGTVAAFMLSNLPQELRQRAAGSGCDNGVPIGGTACRAQGEGVQFRCQAGSTPTAPIWSEESCNGGRCSGSSCQGAVAQAPASVAPATGGSCAGVQCGGCLNRCVPWTEFSAQGITSGGCNAIIDKLCQQATCGGEGTSPAAGQQCCSGLRLCANGRCGASCSLDSNPLCADGVREGSNCGITGKISCTSTGSQCVGDVAQTQPAVGGTGNSFSCYPKGFCSSSTPRAVACDGENYFQTQAECESASVRSCWKIVGQTCIESKQTGTAALSPCPAGSYLSQMSCKSAVTLMKTYTCYTKSTGCRTAVTRTESCESLSEFADSTACTCSLKTDPGACYGVTSCTWSFSSSKCVPKSDTSSTNSTSTTTSNLSTVLKPPSTSSTGTQPSTTTPTLPSKPEEIKTTCYIHNYCQQTMQIVGGCTKPNYYSKQTDCLAAQSTKTCWFSKSGECSSKTYEGNEATRISSCQAVGGYDTKLLCTQSNPANATTVPVASTITPPSQPTKPVETVKGMVACYSISSTSPICAAVAINVSNPLSTTCAQISGMLGYATDFYMPKPECEAKLAKRIAQLGGKGSAGFCAAYPSDASCKSFNTAQVNKPTSETTPATPQTLTQVTKPQVTVTQITKVIVLTVQDAPVRCTQAGGCTCRNESGPYIVSERPVNQGELCTYNSSVVSCIVNGVTKKPGQFVCQGTKIVNMEKCLNGTPVLAPTAVADCADQDKVCVEHSNASASCEAAAATQPVTEAQPAAPAAQVITINPGQTCQAGQQCLCSSTGDTGINFTCYRKCVGETSPLLRFFGGEACSTDLIDTYHCPAPKVMRKVLGIPTCANPGQNSSSSQVAEVANPAGLGEDGQITDLTQGTKCADADGCLCVDGYNLLAELKENEWCLIRTCYQLQSSDNSCQATSSVGVERCPVGQTMNSDCSDIQTETASQSQPTTEITTTPVKQPQCIPARVLAKNITGSEACFDQDNKSRFQCPADKPYLHSVPLWWGAVKIEWCGSERVWSRPVNDTVLTSSTDECPYGKICECPDGGSITSDQPYRFCGYCPAGTYLSPDTHEPVGGQCLPICRQPLLNSGYVNSGENIQNCVSNSGPHRITHWQCAEGTYLYNGLGLETSDVCLPKCDSTRDYLRVDLGTTPHDNASLCLPSQNLYELAFQCHSGYTMIKQGSDFVCK